MDNLNILNNFLYYDIQILYFIFCGVTFTSSLICFYQDLNLNNVKNTKIQYINKMDIINTYKKCLLPYFTNIFIFTPIILGIYQYFIDYTNSYTLYDICMLPIIYVLSDIFFYIGHRLFHTNILYKFHKKHHEIIKPVSISALYLHPIDFIFGNILPLFLPCLFLSNKIYTYYIWVVIIMTNTITISHHGEKNKSEFHDLHHKFFKFNYGTELCIMDNICKTKFEPKIYG